VSDVTLPPGLWSCPLTLCLQFYKYTCVVFTLYTVESLRRVTLHRVKPPRAKSAYIYFMFVFLTLFKRKSEVPASLLAVGNKWSVVRWVLLDATLHSAELCTVSSCLTCLQTNVCSEQRRNSVSLFSNSQHLPKQDGNHQVTRGNARMETDHV
jgi:hypothetical protein